MTYRTLIPALCALVLISGSVTSNASDSFFGVNPSDMAAPMDTPPPVVFHLENSSEACPPGYAEEPTIGGKNCHLIGVSQRYQRMSNVTCAEGYVDRLTPLVHECLLVSATDQYMTSTGTDCGPDFGEVGLRQAVIAGNKMCKKISLVSTYRVAENKPCATGFSEGKTGLGWKLMSMKNCVRVAP